MENEERRMIITMSGMPGSGKSTVAQMLAERLGWKRHYVGGMRREAARKRGMTIDEYNRLGETDPSTDWDVDKLIEEIGRKEDNVIVEGRTAFHFIPRSFKVYLDVDPREGARRICNDRKKDERNEVIPPSVDEMLEHLMGRVASDRKRYEQYYGFDCYDTGRYDLVIDTTTIPPEEAAAIILEQAREQEGFLKARDGYKKK